MPRSYGLFGQGVQSCHPMSNKLIDIYPEFEMLSWFQPRLDKAGITADEFIDNIIADKYSFKIAIEIKAQGRQACIRFLAAFEQTVIIKIITDNFAS